MHSDNRQVSVTVTGKSAHNPQRIYITALAVFVHVPLLVCCSRIRHVLFTHRSGVLNKPSNKKQWRFSVYHVRLCGVQDWGMPAEQDQAHHAGASPARSASKPNRYACVHISVCMHKRTAGCMQVPWRCCVSALPLSSCHMVPAWKADMFYCWRLGGKYGVYSCS